MKITLYKFTGFALLLAFLSGCASMQRDERMSRQHAKEIAGLIQSVSTNTEGLQHQRDAIAKSSQRQRDALETIASRQELNLAEMLAAWNIAGDVKRKNMFDAVKVEADKLAAMREKRTETARQQAEVLSKIRSEVKFNNAKINEAAVNLIRLAEPPTSDEEREFLLSFAKAVNDDIKKDQDTEIAAQASKALADDTRKARETEIEVQANKALTEAKEPSHD